MAKAQNQVGHKLVRPKQYIPSRYLEQVDFDFKGPYPKSFEGRRWILSAIDSHIGWAENYPVESKSQCADVLERFIREHGLMDRVRSDNAPEFRGDKSRWRAVCAKQQPKVIVTFS